MVFTQNRESDYVLWVKVVCDQDYMREHALTEDDVKAKFEADLDAINDSMPSYKMVKRFFISDRPTIKTTTMKTKRREEIKQIEQELRERGLK
jgi:long-chain acyl-CoA synthetase